jgi:hypothetical protein
MLSNDYLKIKSTTQEKQGFALILFKILEPLLKNKIE